jgi:hypothetical protein
MIHNSNFVFIKNCSNVFSVTSSQRPPQPNHAKPYDTKGEGEGITVSFSVWLNFIAFAAILKFIEFVTK